MDTLGRRGVLTAGLAAALGLAACTTTTPRAVVALRRAGVVASVTPYEQQYLRFGPSIVTTPAQMDRVVDAVRALRP